MDFRLTDEQERLAAAVRDLADQFDDEYWMVKDRNHEFPWDFYNAFAEQGWLGIAVPEEYGGGGLGITEAALVLEQIAESGAAMNGCSALHLTIFGFNVVTKHGSEALRKEILPRVVTGDLHACFAVTEPDAGIDTSRVKTVARREVDEYVVTGRKLWITKAGDAEKMILLTRTTPRDEVTNKFDGMTLLLADLDPDHVEIRPIPKVGRNAVASNEVFIDGLRVPVEARLGEEGKGFKCLLDGLNPERILLAHEAVGIGRAALRRAVAYAKERVVFDRPIGMNQGVAFPLAESLAQLDAAHLMARKAAWMYDQGMACGREANAAKLLCADAGFTAADRAMQTHGGLGYASEYHVERYWREARLMRIAPITQEMVLNYLAEHTLGLPRSY